MEKQELNQTGHHLIKRKISIEKQELRKRDNGQQLGDENGKTKVKRSIQSGRETRFYFERVLNLQYCSLLFSGINIALTLLYYQSDYTGKKSISEICLTMLFFTLILEIIVTVFRYMAQVELQKSQIILDPQENIFSSGKSFNLGLEILLLLLQPYPLINGVMITTSDIYDKFNFEFKLNYILVLFGFLKIFTVLRVILRKQIYMSPRSSRLCRMYGCQADYLYAIKCLFKDSPMSLIGIVFVTSILIFAISLRICQRNLNIEFPKYMNSPNPQDIQNFQNALWLTIITMTTVGYGDFYPRTILGRVIDVFLVVWGTFIVSLMVVVLTNTLNMDQSQKRALIVLNRLQAKKSLKESAAFLITHSCKKYLIQKRVKKGDRPPLTDEQKLKMDNSFYKQLTNFQNVHRTIRSMYEIDDVYEEMTRQFEFINDEINILLGSQQKTIANLKNYLEDEPAPKKENDDDEDEQQQSQLNDN